MDCMQHVHVEVSEPSCGMRIWSGRPFSVYTTQSLYH